MKRYIIAFVIIFLIIAICFISIPGNEYHIYELKTNYPQSNEKNIWRSDYSREHKMEVDEKFKDGSYFKRTFSFYLAEHTEFEKEYKFLFTDEYKYIYTEPYDLLIRFSENENVKHIIINKIVFRSGDKVIDLRQIISIQNSFYRPIEEELSDFRNSGLIDIEKIKSDNDRKYMGELDFWYKNVDVVFKNDRKFTIDFDFTFVYNDGKTSNCDFTAQFNRRKVTEKQSFLGLVL